MSFYQQRNGSSSTFRTPERVAIHYDEKGEGFMWLVEWRADLVVSAPNDGTARRRLKPPNSSSYKGDRSRIWMIITARPGFAHWQCIPSAFVSAKSITVEEHAQKTITTSLGRKKEPGGLSGCVGLVEIWGREL